MRLQRKLSVYKAKQLIIKICHDEGFGNPHKIDNYKIVKELGFPRNADFKRNMSLFIRIRSHKYGNWIKNDF